MGDVEPRRRRPGQAGRRQEPDSQKFGAAQSASSALAYDLVALAAGIVKRYGAAGFSSQVAGHAGRRFRLHRHFRLLHGGLSQRGHAVYEIGVCGTMHVVSHAPASFGGG